MSREGIEPIVHTVSRICEPRLSETGSEMEKHCPSFFIGVWRCVPVGPTFQEIASALGELCFVESWIIPTGTLLVIELVLQFSTIMCTQLCYLNVTTCNGIVTNIYSGRIFCYGIYDRPYTNKSYEKTKGIFTGSDGRCR